MPSAPALRGTRVPRTNIENFDLIVCFWKKPLKGITSQLSDQFEETFGIFSGNLTPPRNPFRKGGGG
jgi:hypothetical protein